MKVVINTCFGGFNLSEIALDVYHAKTGSDIPYWEIPRNDTTLIWIVEHLGEAAGGKHTQLKVVEIPNDVDWYIDDYDGNETVAERHRFWG